MPPPTSHPHLVPRFILDTEAARVAGVSLRTVTRWRSTRITDAAALAALRAHVYGLIPHPAWSDWTVDDRGDLVSARGLRPVNPQQLAAVALAFSQVADLRRRVLALQAALEAARQPAHVDAGTAANDAHPDQLPLALARRHA